MHLVIAHAGASTAALRDALPGLKLPHLTALLARMRSTRRDVDEPTSLSPPHERAEAQALGLDVVDGALPWAARQAADAGLDDPPGSRAWGLLTPVHLHLGTDQVSLLDPAALDLDDAGSRTLHAAVGELFTSEGFGLHWLSPTAWLVSHDSLDGLATASLDRVVHRNVDRWMAEHAGARLLKRLQNEAQMLLHGHPLNDARDAAGLPRVNSVWLSHCGRWPAGVARAVPGLSVDRSLSRPALADDAQAWCAAWRQLDDRVIAPLAAAARDGQPVTLTLCGEAAAQRWQHEPRRLWQRLASFGRGTLPAEALTGL